MYTKSGSQPNLREHSKQNALEENIDFSRNKAAMYKNTGEIAYPNANGEYDSAAALKEDVFQSWTP